MSTYVRVDITKDRPDDSVELCEKIVVKHTDEGAASTLPGVLDMTQFGLRALNVKTLRADADKNRNLAQSKYNTLLFTCGIAKGQRKQTKNTLYWFVLNTRDILLVKYRGVEEELQNWGFSVVITESRGRRNLRIAISRTNPKTLVELAEAILTKDLELGAASPLNGALSIPVFSAAAIEARAQYTEWDGHFSLAQSLNMQADVLLGYAEGQNSLSPDTIYYDLCLIRDHLLQRFMGTEEKLSEWGFKVVISSRITGVKKGTKRKQIYTDSVDAGITVVEPTITIEPSVNTKLRIKKLSEGFEVLTFYFGATETSEPVSAQFLTVTNETGAEATLGAIGFPNTYFLVKVTGGVGAKFCLEVVEA